MKKKLAVFITLFIIIGMYIQSKKYILTELKPNTTKELIINNSKFNLTRIFTTTDEITKGLSGVPISEFKQNDIAIFVHPKEDFVQYWMPNTLFPLTIIFIDQYGLIAGIEKLDNFPEHPTESNKQLIPRTGKYHAKYVIEIRQDSSLNTLLNIGDYIEFKGIN